MNRTRTLATAALAVAALAGVTACSQADTASRNLTTASDNFEVQRRVVFFNGITDTYLLEIEGRCSITADTGDGQLEVTCKTGDDPAVFKKHFLGLSDNVSYFVEQLEDVDADPFHYRVVFRPEVIVPDIDLSTSVGDLG
ncbi:beta-sandwich lipoprotein [Brachybacterium sp. DNPG3]